MSVPFLPSSALQNPRSSVENAALQICWHSLQGTAAGAPKPGRRIKAVFLSPYGSVTGFVISPERMQKGNEATGSGLRPGVSL